jgi:hypothetical protein
MPIQLNGWRRLWVVITVLWSIPVAGFAYTNWPHQPNWFEHSGSQADQKGEKFTEAELEEVVRAGQLKPQDDPLLAPDEQSALRTVTARIHRDAVSSLVIRVAAVWLLPAITLYAFGSAVAWVRRGFREIRPQR